MNNKSDDLSGPDNLDNSATASSEQLKAFSEMVSQIAHEINNPLTVITSRSQLLKQTLDFKKPISDENLIQYLDKIQAQSGRIKKIVEAMRMLTSYTAPDKYVERSINSIMHEAYSKVQSNLEENRIEYIFNKNAPERIIRCNPSELVQIFVNLFNNSIEALINTPLPRIEFSYEEDSRAIHFHFSDNGPGISQEIISKIFRPFFTTKAGGATRGLGLSIVRNIARSYGGDIRLEAERGKSFFNISLSKKSIDPKNSSSLKELAKRNLLKLGSEG